MPPRPFRKNNYFGRRYISLRDLCGYLADLDVFPQTPHDGLIEYLEREHLLLPVRQIKLPPSILRRLDRDRHPEEKHFRPIARASKQLEAARELMGLLNFDEWRRTHVHGETEHVLDALLPRHKPFILSDLSQTEFVPWEQRRIPLFKVDDTDILSTVQQDTPSFYHYWQIFLIAALVRSAYRVLYPVNDEELSKGLFRDGIKSEYLEHRTYATFNIEASGEYKDLLAHANLFDAVAYFHDYRDNAYQVCLENVKAGERIPKRIWRRFVKRQEEIAKEAIDRYGVSSDELKEFIGKQCEWWDWNRKRSPEALVEEYKRNISSSIDMYCAITGAKFKDVVSSIGRRTGHSSPTLRVIFPDWVEEQRQLAMRSLKPWVDKAFSTLPSVFSFSESDINNFFDWLEERGLYNFFWHYHRLSELADRDGPVERAASSSEVASFATLVEMIANEAVIDRGGVPRGGSLNSKLRILFNEHSAFDVQPYFNTFKNLMMTKNFTLAQQLAKIARITKGGVHNPIVKTLMGTVTIRNEGAHLGLLKYDRVKNIELFQTLTLATLLIWKVR